MRTAIIQLNAQNNYDENLAKAVRMISQAVKAKAEFILLPEVFIYRGQIDRKIAQNIPGQLSRTLAQISKDKKIYLLAGSILERKANSHRVYNTSLLFSPSGILIKKYRKINLFHSVMINQKVKESDVFAQGRRGALTKVGPFITGLSICYDLRFPLLYRKYATQGVQVLCVPSAFTKMTGQAHWHTLLRARAIENLSYVLAPNQVGVDYRGIQSYGHSMIVDPWGEIIAEASETQEEIIFADLSMDKINEARQKLPGILNKQFIKLQ